MPQLTLWVRGLSRDQILLYIPWHWVTFPSHFFFCPAVKNDSFKGNWNSKKRKKPWKRLLNNFQLWLGIGEIENRLEERWLSSHALDFGWVLVQDNHFLEGELQGDSEITFLFLDPQQRHCRGIRQSPKKPLKETDYEKHEIQAPPLHSTEGPCRGLSVLRELHCLTKEQDWVQIIRGNETWRRLSLPFLEAGVPSRTYTKVLGCLFLCAPNSESILLSPSQTFITLFF